MPDLITWISKNVSHKNFENEDFRKTFIWSLPNSKGKKKAAVGTLTIPAGGGEPILKGDFVTPQHPDGISIDDLKKPEHKEEKEKLVAKLRKMFDEEKKLYFP